LALFFRSALLSKKRIASIAIAIIFANFLLMLFYRGRVWQDGYKLWSDAFKKAPDLARVAGELGNEYARRGEAEKAVKFFTLSEQLNSGEPATVYNLGAIYMDLGKLDLAERYLEEAVKLEPDDVLARVNLGVVYQALGKTSLAQYQFETALQLDPNSALAHNNLGDLFFSTGELRKAEAEFQLALKSDPKNELAHFNLGLTYERAGLWQDALEHFQKAYEQNPGAPDYSLWNGIILLKLKKPKEAEEWIKKTLALDDKYAIAWYYLGLAKKEQGDKQSALKALENSLKNLKPFQSDLKSQIEDLISELKTR
jgi:tetratricopeptide (TPR) repeat protein